MSLRAWEDPSGGIDPGSQIADLYRPSKGGGEIVHSTICLLQRYVFSARDTA